MPHPPRILAIISPGARSTPSRTLTKYCFNASYGKNGYIDAYSELDAEDDVAAKRLGLDWRLPTLDEWEKLGNTSDFTWVWVENYNNTNKNGSLVISKIAGYEGRSIRPVTE